MRCEQLLVTDDDLLASEGRQPSAYARPYLEPTLPPQSMLVYQRQYFEKEHK